MKVIDAIKRLERAGAENSVATQKLKEAAKAVADLIIKEVGERHELPRDYRIISKRSTLGGALFLVHRGEYEFEFINGCGKYLHGDFNSYVPAQTRSACLKFAADIADGLLDEISEQLEREAEAQKAAAEMLEKVKV